MRCRLNQVKQGQLFELVYLGKGELFLRLPSWDDDASRMAITVDDLFSNCRSFNYYSLETDTMVMVREDLKLSIEEKRPR